MLMPEAAIMHTIAHALVHTPAFDALRSFVCMEAPREKVTVVDGASGVLVRAGRQRTAALAWIRQHNHGNLPACSWHVVGTWLALLAHCRRVAGMPTAFCRSVTRSVLGRTHS
eukprot:364785-Chlamydomonas_euryale.AAC.2